METTTKKKRILLVDDEPAVLMVARKRLEVAGFDVVVASDGQDGMDKARAEPPDLIILDLMLPKLNGYEVCTMLKRDLRYKQIPIIIFSAKTQEKDQQMAKECGADAYVPKPYRPDVLLGHIHTLLAPSPSR